MADTSGPEQVEDVSGADRARADAEWGGTPATPARRGTISRVTSRPAAAQHLRDLARLRRVRDRIDREYAQPLDVEALARGVNMSAGHLSRAFRRAYGEPPYGYLMTPAHRARDGAAASWRPQRYRGLLRGRLLVPGHLQHSLHRAGWRSRPASTGAMRRARRRGCRRAWQKQVTRPIRNREAPVTEPQLAWELEERRRPWLCRHESARSKVTEP